MFLQPNNYPWMAQMRTSSKLPAVSKLLRENRLTVKRSLSSAMFTFERFYSLSDSSSDSMGISSIRSFSPIRIGFCSKRNLVPSSPQLSGSGQ